MTVGDLIRVIQRRWLSIALIAVIGLGAAALFTNFRHPVYTSEASLFVSTQDATSVSDLSLGSTYTQQIVKSYAVVATKPYILSSVIEKLHLDESPEALGNHVTATAPVDTVLLYVDADDSSPRRAADIANAVAEELIQRVQSLSPTGEKDGSSVRVTLVGRAVPPVTPSSPSLPINLAIGLLAGAVLGIAVQAVRTQVDNRVRNAAQIALLTAAPVLGVALESGARPFIITTYDRSPHAEAYRAIRTNLAYVTSAAGPTTLMVSSSTEREGKSTTSLNLAAAVAEAGRSVLVVDGDMRRPSIAEYAGVDSTVGLSDVLIGRAALGDVCSQTDIPRLSVCPAGRVPPNPNALLQRREMSELLQQARVAYDLVIVDTPPLLSVSDAAVIASYVDGVILVAEVGLVKAGQLQQALRALSMVGSEALGVVLTKCPPREARRMGFGHSYAEGHQDVAWVRT